MPHVYVRSFPDPGPEIPVSESVGTAPAWAPDGAALWYRGPRGLMRAAVRIGQSVTVTARASLFPLDFIPLGEPFRNLDIDPTGQRFLVGARLRGSDSREGRAVETVMVVVNWFEELAAEMSGPQ